MKFNYFGEDKKSGYERMFTIEVRNEIEVEKLEKALAMNGITAIRIDEFSNYYCFAVTGEKNDFYNITEAKTIYKAVKRDFKEITAMGETTDIIDEIENDINEIENAINEIEKSYINNDIIITDRNFIDYTYGLMMFNIYEYIKNDVYFVFTIKRECSYNEISVSNGDECVIIIVYNDENKILMYKEVKRYNDLDIELHDTIIRYL